MILLEASKPNNIDFGFFLALALLAYIAFKVLQMITGNITLPGENGSKKVYRFARRVREVTHQNTPNEQKMRRILEEEFWYFNQLDSQNQAEFLRRVGEFLKHRTFINRAANNLSEELRMHTLIAATAVQVSFGLHSYLLRHFKHVVVYSRDYRSSLTKKRHRGEVNPRGAVVLSWPSFVEGFQTHNDGVALGIHEFTHALILQNEINHVLEKVLHPGHLSQFTYLAKRELVQMRKGERSFLRDYAKTDIYEFFSVAVEHFFERPVHFIEHHLTMYESLANLLNQDPRDLHLK